VGIIAGIDAYTETMRQFFAGLPDAEAIEQDAAQDGDTVTIRFIVQGTPKPDLGHSSAGSPWSPRVRRHRSRIGCRPGPRRL
jgi:hypothetical protein